MSAPAKTPEPLDTSLPSVRQMQHYARDRQMLEVKLLTGDLVTGHLFWQDPVCICLKSGEEAPIVIWRHALAYLKPLGSPSQASAQSPASAGDTPEAEG